MPRRGEIFKKDRAQQLKDLSGTRWGKITPTDIDAFIDFDNKLFIIIEVKLRGNNMPYGQRLALERLCDSTSVPCFFLLAFHDIKNCEETIDYSCLPLARVYRKGNWKTPPKPYTIKSYIDFLRDKYGIE